MSYSPYKHKNTYVRTSTISWAACPRVSEENEQRMFFWKPLTRDSTEEVIWKNEKWKMKKWKNEKIEKLKNEVRKINHKIPWNKNWKNKKWKGAFWVIVGGNSEKLFKRIRWKIKEIYNLILSIIW